MKNELFGKKTSRNLVNLLAVFALLIIVTACVCQSERGLFNTGDATPTPEDKPANSELANNDADNKTDEPVNKDGNGKNQDKGDFIVEHQGVNNPRYAGLDRQIKQDKTLEKAADKLNRSLILPSDIYLRTKDCGEANAFYNPNDKSVTMCYELMERFFVNFKQMGDTDDEAYENMFDATTFVFLHEIGHALIDNYNLPITANEEDAADRCSSFICIEELGDDGVEAILAAADVFRFSSRNRQPGQADMADEHLLQEQRFFTSLCMLYGSNPGKYDAIKSKGYLPEARAVRCPNEYQRTAQSWSEILAPWRK